MNTVRLRAFALVAGLATSAALPAVGLAQWSNPLLTEGVGSGRDLRAYYYPSGAPAPGNSRARAPGDKNPAETLLREMNGTHYRRRSGQAYFRGPQVEEARRMIARQMARDRRAAQRGQPARQTSQPQPARQARARQPSPSARETTHHAERDHSGGRRSDAVRSRRRALPPPSGPVY